MYDAIAGYGLGGSSIALFGRVGGGIYTKAAEGLICPAKTTMAWKKMITGTPLALPTTSVTTSVISLAWALICLALLRRAFVPHWS